MHNYVFFREIESKPTFYFAEYPTDEAAIAGAIHNVGTTKVETPNGKVIYSSKPKTQGE